MIRARHVAFAGLVIFLTGLIVTGLQGYFTVVSAGLCVAGLLAGSAIFLNRVSRNLKVYLNTVLYSLFFIGSALALFVLVQRHPVSYDATQSKIYSLSPISRNFLKRLDQPVLVTAFMSEADKQSAAQLLREYSHHSRQFSFEIRDPFRDVALARRYGAVMPGDIFVESITTGTAEIGRVVKVSKLAEEELTNAIVQLLRGRELVLYFLTGHGELELEEDRASTFFTGKAASTRNIQALTQQLERAHIRARPLNLARMNRVPSDASAVISIAPRVDLTPAEQQILRTYLDDGGRAIFLLNPDVPQVGREPRLPLNNFAEMLEDFGVLLPNDMVLQPLNQQSSADLFMFPLSLNEHRITRDMQGKNAVYFVQARPVVPSQVPPEHTNLEVIASSPPDAVRVPMDQIAKAYVTRQQLSIEPEEKDFAKHPVGVAVTVQPPEKPEDESTRIVVLGNGNFVSTEVIDQSAWLLFLNAVNWISDSGDLIAIPSTEIENTPVILSAGERQFLFLLIVIIVPSLIALSGLGYSISKRELA